MIIGVGSDIVENERILRLIQRYGGKFLSRVFHSEEIEYCQQKNNIQDRVACFAARFACKEAFIKALPDSFAFTPNLNQIYLQGQVRQKKLLSYSEIVRAELIRKNINGVHCSISHEKNYSLAFVVLERIDYANY